MDRPKTEPQVQAGHSSPTHCTWQTRCPDRNDVLLMVAMVVVYLLVALYNLGSLNVPHTVWQPLHRGQELDIDLGRDVPIDRIYYYCGINENSYADARFSLYGLKGGKFQLLGAIEKKDCSIWQYHQVKTSSSRLKIVADPPGGALNEMVIVEQGTGKPVTIAPGTAITQTLSGGSPANLFDEQHTFTTAPSFLHGFYFDEIYHARTAYEQLRQMEPYENTHPPLGKVLIGAGISVFGMNSFGWRIVSTLFGVALLPIMYLFGKKLFGGYLLPFSAAYLMMVDFMHFTQSRIALIDVFAVVFITLMFYFLYNFFLDDCGETGWQKAAIPLLLSGACFGLGAACKWLSLYAGAGVIMLIGLQLYHTFQNHGRQWGVQRFVWSYLLPVSVLATISFVLIPAAIYLLSYIPYLLVEGHRHGLLDILRNQRDMYAYHSQLKASHPFSSPWWSWPLDLQPVWLYSGTGLPAGQVSTIASFGNPVIWWSALPAVLIAAIIAGKQRDRRMAVIFTGFACQYVPWILVPRVTFIYHFFSVVPFMMLSQVYVMQKAMERFPRSRSGIICYLVLAGLLFVVFYPVLSGLQVSASYVDRLRWLKSWIF